MYRELAAGQETIPPSLTMTQTSLRYLQALLLEGPRAELLGVDQLKIARFEAVRFLTSQVRDEPPLPPPPPSSPRGRHGKEREGGSGSGLGSGLGSGGRGTDVAFEEGLAKMEDTIVEMVELTRAPEDLDEWRIAMQAARQRYDDRAVLHLARLAPKLVGEEEEGVLAECKFEAEDAMAALDTERKEGGGAGGSGGSSQGRGGRSGSGGVCGGPGLAGGNRPFSLAEWTAAMKLAREQGDRARLRLLSMQATGVLKGEEKEKEEKKKKGGAGWRRGGRAAAAGAAGRREQGKDGAVDNKSIDTVEDKSGDGGDSEEDATAAHEISVSDVMVSEFDNDEDDHSQSI